MRPVAVGVRPCGRPAWQSRRRHTTWGWPWAWQRCPACRDTGTLSLQERNDPLWLQAVEESAHAALDQAGLHHNDVDLFELHDAFTIMSALSLESSGFTPRGTATRFAREQGIHRSGALPIS